MTSGTIPSGWYEAEVLEIQSFGEYGLRSGVKIKFFIHGVGQMVTYYIPPGERGYFARKNTTYYLGYTFFRAEFYRLELLIGKFVRMEIESVKDGRGLPSIQVKRFAFSEFLFFPPVKSIDVMGGGKNVGYPDVS